MSQAHKIYDVIQIKGRRAESMNSDVQAFESLKPSGEEMLLVYDTETNTFSLYDHNRYEQDLREVEE